MVHCHCTLSLYIVTVHCPCTLSILSLSTVIVHGTLYSGTVRCHCTLHTATAHCHYTLSLYIVTVHLGAASGFFRGTKSLAIHFSSHVSRVKYNFPSNTWPKPKTLHALFAHSTSTSG